MALPTIVDALGETTHETTIAAFRTAAALKQSVTQNVARSSLDTRVVGNAVAAWCAQFPFQMDFLTPAET